MLYKV